MDWTDIFSSGADAPATDSYTSPVTDSNVSGTDLGTLDNPTAAASDPVSAMADSQPISSQSALEAALANSQDNSPYAPPSNEMQPMAAPASAPAAGPVAQAFNAAKDSQLANDQAQAQAISDSIHAPPGGAISQLMKGLGINGDLSDPRNLESMMKLLMGAGGIANSLVRKGTAQNALSAQQLKQMVQPNSTAFNPQQQAMANNYFNNSVGNFASRPRLFAGDMASPIVAGVGSNGTATGHYANGGMVNGDAAIDPTNMGSADPSQYPYQMATPMAQSMPPVSNNYADGGKVDNGKFVSSGALSLVHGNGSGQDDLVHAKLSPGEYVMDADTVASLGDGNNAHGAKVLDAWREQLRTHKRSADSDSIPPPAKAPNHYLKGGALTAMHDSKGK